MKVINRQIADSLLIGLSALLLLGAGFEAGAKDKKNNEPEKKDEQSSKIYKGLKWRSIGPAMTSGRIADFAVNPENCSEWYVAAASGNVWKTTNNGTTFEPIFDSYGAYSMGVITMDPGNHNILWLGTGENNHQRVLGYGNGVYKSEDGGKSWKNMGLKDSRQIGSIVIDPRNSDIIFVAAEGSAWGPGGDRGLYRTSNGGETWDKVIDISENTGVNNVVMDPVNPDIMYATSEQRRRHTFTKIGGGPESAVYRSFDGGKTWNKAMKGLPSVDLGGMGIAVSPVDHNVVYLIVEAAEDKSGFFRSTDRGASWNKMSDYSAQGQYYNEIYCDPVDVDKVYSMETYSKYTLDGGTTWTNIGNDNRHVDDHAFWIEPADPLHFLIGGDGGIYETFDGGKNYLFKRNLPVTQFYRVFVDNDFPFYNVMGGTQDNRTLSGPSRNKVSSGVSSEDWKFLAGGDGFWVAVDPEDPNIVYYESQYGNMVRLDQQSGEIVDIQPMPRKGEKTYKWNWNTPLIISHHSRMRIYTMANKVFRSDDRGNSWEVISDDLTSQTDRNSWPVMDHYWSYDAVQKDVSTSLWGTGVSLCESPLDENLLYAGTDDGVVSITENGGGTWRSVKSFPGVPEYSYVSDLMADRFDADIVYATFNNEKRDDFKPYVLKSTDRGRTWTSISSNLPENGMVHTLQQDTEVPGLLFAGTEFGFYFSLNGGGEWIEFTSGLPAINVQDITIQERENDLVIATFGRGFYILDDYTPLRQVAKDQSITDNKGFIFEIPDALMYVQSRGKMGQGSNFYLSENPPFGAAFTYFLKEVPETLKEQRKKKEKELFEKKEPIPQPSREQLREEEEEVAPYLVFSVYDESGQVIRRIENKASSGINRVSWDLRYSSFRPVSESSERRRGRDSDGGLLAMPGKYAVDMEMVVRGESVKLADPVSFVTVTLNEYAIPVSDRDALAAFQKEVSDLARIMMGTERMIQEQTERVQAIQKALKIVPGADFNMLKKAIDIEKQLNDLTYTLDGPPARASWEELPPMDMPLNRRMNVMVMTHWSATSDVTKTERDQLEILREEFPPVLDTLKEVTKEIDEMDRMLDEIKAPWTPGRMPSMTSN